MKKALKKAKCNVWYYSEGRKIDGYPSGLSGNVSGLRGNVSGLSGDVSGLSGDVSGLRGDATGLIGDATGLSGNFDDCALTSKERHDGVDVRDLIDS